MASPSSLGNRRARRGSVSQNITHTAVGFMSSNGALLSSLPLPLILFYLFLPSSLRPPPFLPPSMPLTPLGHRTVVLFFPSLCHFKTTPPTPPTQTYPSSSPKHRHHLLPSIATSFTFFASHHHPCHLWGTRQGLVLHHSYPGGRRRRRRHSACTQI